VKDITATGELIAHECAAAAVAEEKVRSKQAKDK
jgi:hypothetical protein